MEKQDGQNTATSDFNYNSHCCCAYCRNVACLPRQPLRIVRSSGGDNGSGLEPPTMVGEPEYDEATGTFSATFQFKNSFPVNITIKSLTGNIPVSIDAGETGTLTIVGAWTNAAKSHFETGHKNEEFVDVVLVDFAVDISGIQIALDPSQMEQTMQVPNPAY